jgi:hypothetical protein
MSSPIRAFYVIPVFLLALDFLCGNLKEEKHC